MSKNLNQRLQADLIEANSDQNLQIEDGLPYQHIEVVDINIHFSDYLAKQELLLIEEKDSSNDHRYEGYLFEEIIRQGNPIVERKRAWLFGFIPYTAKTVTPTQRKELKAKELVLIIRERTKKDGGINLSIDITVYEGDEKEMFVALYDRIVEHATTYMGLYNQYIENWVTLIITRHISLKQKYSG